MGSTRIPRPDEERAAKAIEKLLSCEAVPEISGKPSIADFMLKFRDGSHGVLEVSRFRGGTNSSTETHYKWMQSKFKAAPWTEPSPFGGLPTTRLFHASGRWAVGARPKVAEGLIKSDGVDKALAALEESDVCLVGDVALTPLGTPPRRSPDAALRTLRDLEVLWARRIEELSQNAVGGGSNSGRLSLWVEDVTQGGIDPGAVLNEAVVQEWENNKKKLETEKRAHLWLWADRGQFVSQVVSGPDFLRKHLESAVLPRHLALDAVWVAYEPDPSPLPHGVWTARPGEPWCYREE